MRRGGDKVCSHVPWLKVWDFSTGLAAVVNISTNKRHYLKTRQIKSIAGRDVSLGIITVTICYCLVIQETL